MVAFGLYKTLKIWGILQYIIKAPKDAKVQTISYNEGETVAKGTTLVHFEEEDQSKKEIESE